MFNKELMTNLGYNNSEVALEEPRIFDVTEELGLGHIVSGMWVKYTKNDAVLGMRVESVINVGDGSDDNTYIFSYKLPESDGLMNIQTIFHKYTGTQEAFIEERIHAGGEYEVDQVFMDDQAYMYTLKQIAENLTVGDIYQAARKLYSRMPGVEKSDHFWTLESNPTNGDEAQEVDIVFGLYRGEWETIIKQAR